MIRPDFTRRTSRASAAGAGALLAVTLIAVAVFALDAMTGGIIRNAAQGTVAYLWGGMSVVGTSISQTGFFARNASLATENAELRRELARVQERAAAYQSVRDENEVLRALANLAASAPGIAAPVVSAYHASPYGTFQIGAGRAAGVAVGDIVLSSTGFAIGRVTDVQPERATVQTAFVANSTIDVIIADAAVTAIGEGGGNARVSVPRGIDVAAGDTVLSPAFGARPVGIIGKVEEITTTAEQRLHISLPVNISLLRLVYVIPSP